MESAWRTVTQQHAQRLEALTSAILRNDAAQRITLMRERLQNSLLRLTRAQIQLLQTRRASLLSLERHLAALSPLAVLNRGYALVYDENDVLLKNVSALTPGQILSTRLASGSIESRITKIKPDQGS